MRLLKYLKDAVEGWQRNNRRLNEEYTAAYRRCFEGTPEEVERRLYAWDSVHRATRSY